MLLSHLVLFGDIYPGERERIPVHNVALPLLRRLAPEGPWFRTLELPLDEPA